MPPRWRVLREPERDGEYHMRRDFELLQAQQPGGAPVLRLYSWSPPCISFGYMQDPLTLLDLDACREARIDVVRRPTGGRAILHWEEITYALVAALDDERFGRNLASSHATIGACLAAGLEHLGIRAELSRPALDPERRLLRQPCFASPGRAELLVRGRKALGSAQRRGAHAFLQHGSLLVGPAHERLVELLRDTHGDAGLVESMRARLQRDTITLRELLGCDPAFDVLADAVVAGFQDVLGLDAHI